MNRRLLPAAGGGGFAQPVENVSLTPPIRAAYYFPWFPEAWTAFLPLATSHYTASLGDYSQFERATIEQHLAWCVEAHIDAIIITWMGRPDGVGISHETFTSWPDGDIRNVGIMDLAYQYGIKVCILYGVESLTTPTQAQIEAEFEWLAANRFNHRAYLHVDGRPVVFVYTEEDKSSALCAKYSAATDGFTTAYILMQTATDPSSATPQPDAWYTFTTARTSATTGSYTILPEFWRYDQESPITSRDLTTWQSNVASMAASGADWQLVISFNEWMEGSIIEPTVELGTAYLDALAAVP